MSPIPGWKCSIILLLGALKMYLEIERARAIAEDEDSDSDERSDHITATPATSSDCSPIPLLRRTAKKAKFTVTSPPSNPSGSPSPTPPTHATGAKRPKGHPDAPTPNPSPAKRRISKRRSYDTLPPPSQPIFTASSSPSTRTATVDVFGPVNCHREQDGYGTDSEGESGGEGVSGRADDDEYYWGPEDDAPGPPDSQTSPHTTSNEAAMHPDDDTLYRDLPTLQDVSDSETSDSDDAGDDSGDNSGADSVPDLEVDNTVDDAMLAHANRVHTTPPRAQPAKPAAAGRGKITSYWKVETAEEKVVRLEKDAREYAERAEEVRLREVEEKRKKHAKAPPRPCPCREDS
ncbi:hypothetical protein B0H14DRAFT_2581045 [Mycena olivaceomarginata]|nr:hypothetical protein B0H14DRAFT_2581045 [Mycena olivaceomarginata]